MTALKNIELRHSPFQRRNQAQGFISAGYQFPQCEPETISSLAYSSPNTQKTTQNCVFLGLGPLKLERKSLVTAHTCGFASYVTQPSERLFDHILPSTLYSETASPCCCPISRQDSPSSWDILVYPGMFHLFIGLGI